MEKILVFGVTDTTYEKIKQIARRMKLGCEQFSSDCHSCTLTQLLHSDTASAPEAVSSRTDASESLLVMCNLSDKRVDKLLFELRRSDIDLDYKAILTPTNGNWAVSRLLFELRREKKHLF